MLSTPVHCYGLQTEAVLLSIMGVTPQLSLIFSSKLLAVHTTSWKTYMMAAIPSTAMFVRTSACICKPCRYRLDVRRGAGTSGARTFSTASTPRAPNAPQQKQQSCRPDRAVSSNPIACAVLPRVANPRLYSTTNNVTQSTDSGVAPLLHRRLISLSGPDTVKFLQGLITNNVHADRKQPFFAAFLDSRGRVLWDVFVWVYPELLAGRDTWSCYIEVDGSELEALRKHLKRHKLRSKVSIDVVPEGELAIWAAWGQAYGVVNTDAVVATLCDPRGDMSSLWRFLVKPNSGLAFEGLHVQGTQQYHLQRYKQGIAEGPIEIPRESALPMEVNIDLAQGIDFKKGCYVGQELTIRTKHTGVVRKRILPIRLHPAAPATPLIESGSDIKQLDRTDTMKKGRAAGKFVASIGNVGLALCRLEMMTPMRVSAEGGSYRDGIEFGVIAGNSEDIVKVKPILHQWFVRKEQQLWAKTKPKVMAELGSE